jgi:hypothetical protein
MNTQLKIAEEENNYYVDHLFDFLTLHIERLRQFIETFHVFPENERVKLITGWVEIGSHLIDSFLNEIIEFYNLLDQTGTRIFLDRASSHQFKIPHNRILRCRVEQTEKGEERREEAANGKPIPKKAKSEK